MKKPLKILGDLVRIVSGFAFKSEFFGISDGIPIIRIRDVLRGYSDTLYSGGYEPEYLIQNGDMLIGMDGEFNRARWQGGPAILNQRVCKIASNSYELDDGYLYHFLPAALKEIEAATPFVTVKHLSAKDIRAIQIPLPPLAEQRRIATILDHAEALRAKRRETIADVSILSRSIFLEIFGHPMQNPRRFSSPPLGSLCDRVTVGYVGAMAEEYVDSGVPLLRSLNVRRGFIGLDDLKFITPEFHSKISKSAISHGDVVTVRTGQPGTTSVVPAAFKVANCADLIVMTCGAHLDPHYLAEALNIWLGDAETIQGQVGAIQVHFNIARAKELLMPCPPLALQQEFARQVAAIDRLKAAHQASLAKLDELFASLQHRAFRGELTGAGLEQAEAEMVAV